MDFDYYMIAFFMGILGGIAIGIIMGSKPHKKSQVMTEPKILDPIDLNELLDKMNARLPITNFKYNKDLDPFVQDD